MNDLTCIFLTVNRVPEQWAAYQKQVLLEAVGTAPVITISREPLDWGLNLIQEGEVSASNVYRQLLRGAKVATTPYIAVAEDDALYPKEHFTKFRPKNDEFAYNFSRWGLLSWGEPTYFWCDRISNLTLIAPTKLVIEALEERFAKYPDGTPEGQTGELGRYKRQKDLGTTQYKAVAFYTTVPIVNFSHPDSLCPHEQKMKKRRGFVRAYDIPYWGHARDLQKKFV